MIKMKRIASLLITMVLICALSIPVLAHEIPDASKKGSIAVTMQDGESIVAGGSLTLYRVGDVKETDGNYDFALTEAFRACGVSLEDLESEEAAKELAKYAKSHAIENTTEEIDEEGMGVFRELDIGLYLIVQEDAAEGYLAVNPFLVTVPMIEGEYYVYNVDASPKVDPEKAPETTEPPTQEGTTAEQETSKPGQTGKPQLPLTGQLNWPVPVMVVLGLALILVGCTLRFGRKKGNQS